MACACIDWLTSHSTTQPAGPVDAAGVRTSVDRLPARAAGPGDRRRRIDPVPRRVAGVAPGPARGPLRQGRRRASRRAERSVDGVELLERASSAMRHEVAGQPLGDQPIGPRRRLVASSVTADGRVAHGRPPPSSASSPRAPGTGTELVVVRGPRDGDRRACGRRPRRRRRRRPPRTRRRRRPGRLRSRTSDVRASQ